MRCFLPCLLALACAAGEPAAPVLSAADGALVARLPDLARSRERWARTAYPVLLATSWGRTLQAEWGGRLERLAPGAGAAWASLRSLVIQADATRPLVVEAVGDAAMLRAALAAVLPRIDVGAPEVLSGAAGRAELHDERVVFIAGEGVAPPAPVDLDDDGADARLRVAVRQQTAVTCRFTLDGIGLREDVAIAASTGSRAAAQVATRWADPEELRRLPERTLWAATTSADAVALNAWLAAAPAAELESAEAMLARAGLPGLAATLRSLDGPATVWMAEGVPFPSLTAAISMSAEAAQGWIAAARLHLGLAPTATGAAGFVGLLPVALGVVADNDAGRPPRLVITTDPVGLEVWTKRGPGFATHPAVAQVLGAPPERCVVLGVGRGGASWATLAQLAVPLFVGLGAPQAVSLPTDLRNVAGHGWFHARLLADGRIEAAGAGLFGGPCSVLLAAGVAVPATIWLRGELERSGVIAPVGPPPPREF